MTTDTKRETREGGEARLTLIRGEGRGLQWAPPLDLRCRAEGEHRGAPITCERDLGHKGAHVAFLSYGTVAWGDALATKETER